MEKVVGVFELLKMAFETEDKEKLEKLLVCTKDCVGTDAQRSGAKSIIENKIDKL